MDEKKVSANFGSNSNKMLKERRGGNKKRKPTHPSLVIRRIPEFILVLVKFIIDSLGHFLRYLNPRRYVCCSVISTNYII